METPRFLVSSDANQVFLDALPHSQPAAVLFEMLDVTSLRTYNTVSPKEENMHLAQVADQPTRRMMVSELPPQETHHRSKAVVDEFTVVWRGLAHVSAAQTEALIELARQRIAHDHLED